jgi:hypothetical protein
MRLKGTSRTLYIDAMIAKTVFRGWRSREKGRDNTEADPTIVI